MNIYNLNMPTFVFTLMSVLMNECTLYLIIKSSFYLFRVDHKRLDRYITHSSSGIQVDSQKFGNLNCAYEPNHLYLFRVDHKRLDRYITHSSSGIQVDSQKFGNLNCAYEPNHLYLFRVDHKRLDRYITHSSSGIQVDSQKFGNLNCAYEPNRMKNIFDEISKNTVKINY